MSNVTRKDMAMTDKRDAEILLAIKQVRLAVAELDDPADRAAVLFEIALNNFAQALLDAGKDITDQALLAMANRAVAGWILAQERRTN
jgi:hypothetical protein